jgi:hypothetical protein
MVSIRHASVKLSHSFTSYVQDCCLLMAVAVVLFTRLRRDQIRWKSERVIYNFGIQGFQSCHFGL